jgi:AcrR family transcriptional regulator
LLEAAAEACVEVGFDAVTLADVAARADVTPAAVYNHFDGKSELLYAAGRRAIDELGARVAPAGEPAGATHDVVAAFLSPSFRDGRRLVLELHLAGSRHPELGEHLARWHREFASMAIERSPKDARDAAADVHALFLLLLGCCHLEELSGLGTPDDVLVERIERLVDALYGTSHPSST